MAKSKKRDIIFIAAAKLFRDRGYQATSMRDLAEAVDLKASSLYNHIGSKEEILKEICMANAEKFSLGMEQINTQDINPLQKIELLIKLHIDIAKSDYTSVTSFNDEWRHLGEPALTDFKTKRRDYERQFLQIIKEGVALGILQDIHPQIYLHTILSSMQWVYHSSSDLEADDIHKGIRALLVDGVAKK